MDTNNQTINQDGSNQTQYNDCVKKLKTIIDELSKDPGFQGRLDRTEERHKKYVAKLNNGLDNDKKTLESILTGAGIASIRGSLSGLKMTSEDYAKRFDYNKVVEKLGPKNNNDQNTTDSTSGIEQKADVFSVEELEAYKTFFDELCELFPNKSCNNITNRFVATYFFDKLTTIVKPEAVCEVLEYLGVKGLKSDDKYWYPYSLYLRHIIKEVCQDTYKDFDKAALGWELVEYIRTIKKNDELFKNSKNIILTGAPGTGKTFLAHLLAKRLACNNESQIKMVQFHPSYDYSDFVEGLRPEHNTNTQIGFVHKDGVFKSFCEDALKHGYKRDDNGNYTENGEYHIKEDGELEAVNSLPKYVFIIDEINRGEISKIFGELFFSIDPGYRGIAGKIQTQYANLQDTPNEFDKALGIKSNNKYGHFFVPDNVYIIGTMNDIDRSVESMDFAMRRRFTFVEVTAEDRQNMLDELDNAEELKMRMNNINTAIDKIPGLNSAYHIGPAYFKKYKDCTGSTAKQKFEMLWNNHIKGLVYEYLRGNPEADKYIDEIKKAYNKNVEY